MKFAKIEVRPEAVATYRKVESAANRVVRGYDQVMGVLRLGGRKSGYDDHAYEFNGGARDELRKKHYDKSLRLLWKAEQHMPWSTFHDCTKDELSMMAMAESSLSRKEKEEIKRIRTEDYKKLINQEYTQEQKQAIVNILSLIGHGEAYAWLVSTEVLRDVKSTGGRGALTMQVLEEAKHFVVLRELLQAFDCEIPRMSAWEYFLLERILKMRGLEKFFGMNVVVEGFALSLFGMMSSLPGLEILRLFHLDESRHTALPSNYFQEFPMTEWQKRNPVAQLRRLSLILPALPILWQIESDLAELGIDSFDFGGSMVRKIFHLAERVGFYTPIPAEPLKKQLNTLFNAYAAKNRPGHSYKEYFEAETTTGRRELQVERDVFRMAEAASA